MTQPPGRDNKNGSVVGRCCPASLFLELTRQEAHTAVYKTPKTLQSKSRRTVSCTEERVAREPSGASPGRMEKAGLLNRHKSVSHAHAAHPLRRRLLPFAFLPAPLFDPSLLFSSPACPRDVDGA